MKFARRFAALPASIRGACWMVLAGMLFVAASTSIRKLSFGMHFIEIAFFRSLIGILFMTPWLMRVGIGAMRTRHSRYYLLRGATSTAASFCWFGALAIVPVADATSISFVTPLFTAIAAVVFLSEPMRANRWIGLIVGFIGTLIILRPGFVEVNVGALMVLGSAVFISWSAILIKVLARDDRPDTIALYQLVYMLPMTLVPALFVWQWPNQEQLFLAVLVAGFSTFAQRALTRAFAAADATAVMPFDFMRLPFAIALGFVVFSELPDLWTILGGLVIFAATAYAGHGEARRRRAG